MNCPICNTQPDYFIVSRGAGTSLDFCLKKPEQMTEEFVRENPRFSCIKCEHARAKSVVDAYKNKVMSENEQ
jgi:hypothetical protein